MVPATPSGSGSSAARNRVATHSSYAAAVANGPAVAVNVTGKTTSVVPASVASPSSAATKSSKKPKLSADVPVPATMVDRTGGTILPPATDLLTTELKKKSPKKHGDFAVRGCDATTTSVMKNC